MGKEQSKVANANGNVINEIEIIEAPQTTNILLIVLVVVIVGKTLIKTFLWHRQSLKRKYFNKALSMDQLA